MTRDDNPTTFADPHLAAADLAAALAGQEVQVLSCEALPCGHVRLMFKGFRPVTWMLGLGVVPDGPGTLADRAGAGYLTAKALAKSGMDPDAISDDVRTVAAQQDGWSWEVYPEITQGKVTWYLMAEIPAADAAEIATALRGGIPAPKLELVR